MFKFLGYLSRPQKGLLLGSLLGLVWVGASSRLFYAQATLFFPSCLVLPAEGPPQEGESAQSKPPEPTSWAESELTSKDATDMICKKIERSQAEGKAEALRSACLLSEGKRITVETLPNSCLRLRVAAEDPTIAVSLCQGLLAYLSYKTKIPLEDPEVEKLSAAEKQLRVKERSLAQALWGQLAFDAPQSQDPNAQQTLQLDLVDYQGLMSNYRQVMRQHFFREARTAAAGPSFTVLEPPFATTVTRPWLQGALAGGLLGLLGSFLLGRIGSVSGRRKNVPWRIQERGPSRRTPPAEPVDVDRQRTNDG